VSDLHVYAHTATPTVIDKPRVEFDRDIANRVDQAEDNNDYAGWYCVRTDSFPCPAPGCDFIAFFMTVAHHIVVWPAKDDPMLLTYARDAAKLGRNPRVVDYDPDFGPCIPFDLWVNLGRPVHGKLPDPDGWADNWKRL
jgi:hypothetical protein